MFGNLFFSKKKEGTPPSDMGERIVYAVGDVHGRADLLDAIILAILEDLEATAPRLLPTIVFLGDYIDRGIASKQVIERIIQLAKHVNVAPLKGNHEQWMLAFLKDASVGRRWFKYGGEQTLASYGVLPAQDEGELEAERVRADLQERMPASHKEFLESLTDYVVIGDYLFVHAGVRPGVELEGQTSDDLLSIRSPFLEAEQSCEHVVVHGHTPEPTPVNRRWRIGIDTGAYATGVLTAVRLFETDRRFIQTLPEQGAKMIAQRASPLA